MKSIGGRLLIAALVVLSACTRESPTQDASVRPSSPVITAGRAERERRIDFTNVALVHIAEHFASISGRKITVAPEIAQLKIGGSMKIDGVDQFLALLPQALPVRVEIDADGSVRILPKESRD